MVLQDENEIGEIWSNLAVLIEDQLVAPMRLAAMAQ
jgi:hypothetical protein